MVYSVLVYILVQKFPKLSNHLACQSKVHLMDQGLQVSGAELVFLSAWRRGYGLNNSLWRTGAIKCKYWRTVLLILTPQVYTSVRRWRTHEELPAYLRRGFYIECTSDISPLQQVIIIILTWKVNIKNDTGW